MSVTNGQLMPALPLEADVTAERKVPTLCSSESSDTPANVNDASRPEFPVCIGNIECLDNGMVVGWIASIDNERFMGGVSIYIDGQFAGDVGEYLYRQDLDEAGISDGYAMFKVNCSHCIGEESREHAVIAVQRIDGERILLLDAELMSYSHEPLNPNVAMVLKTPHEINDWRVECEPEAGLRLEQYSASAQVADIASSYTRFAFTERLLTHELMSFSCDIAIPNHTLIDNLELGFLIRSDRHTKLTISLRKNGETISKLSTHTDNSWIPRSYRLENTKNLIAKAEDRYELRVAVSSLGRSYLDVAYICVAEHLSNDLLEGLLLFQPDIAPTNSGLPTDTMSYVSNGDLERWSNGLVLGEIGASSPMADGWTLACREYQRSSVTLSLNVYESPNNGSTDQSKQSFGLRLRTGDLPDTVTLETDLLMSFLDRETLKLSIGISSLEQRLFSEVSRITLTGKGIDRECLIHVIAQHVKVRGNDTLEFRINEGDMVNIRRGCAGFPSIKLGIEFGSHTEVILKSVNLKDEDSDQTRSAPSLPTAAFTQFEDEAVSSQIGRVKGLEFWSKEGTVTPEEGYLVDQRRISASVLDTVVTPVSLPKIERPEVAYPSVDIIVPVYNALDSVVECIQSVMAKTTIPFTLILVDDCSAPETETFLCQIDTQYQNVVVIRNSANQGYTKSVNAGLSRATSDLVCILNSDCIVTDLWIQKLIDCARSSEDIGIVGPLSNAASYQSVPRIHNDSGSWSFNPLPCSMPPQELADLIAEISECSYPSASVINGFCQVITRKVIDQIGLLDEESFPRGFGEENDYCARAKKAGFRIVIADDTYVYHTKSQSFGHAERERLSQLGAHALKTKHADVNWDHVVQDIEQAPALVALRRKLISLGH